MKPWPVIDSQIALEIAELRDTLLALKQAIEWELGVIQTSGCMSVQHPAITDLAIVARQRHSRIIALESLRAKQSKDGRAIRDQGDEKPLNKIAKFVERTKRSMAKGQE